MGRAVTADTIAEMRRLRAEEKLSTGAIAARVGFSRDVVQKYAPAAAKTNGHADLGGNGHAAPGSPASSATAVDVGDAEECARAFAAFESGTLPAQAVIQLKLPPERVEAYWNAYRRLSATSTAVSDARLDAVERQLNFLLQSFGRLGEPRRSACTHFKDGACGYFEAPEGEGHPAVEQLFTSPDGRVTFRPSGTQCYFCGSWRRRETFVLVDPGVMSRPI